MTIIYGIAIVLIGYLTGLNLGIYITKKELSAEMTKYSGNLHPSPCPCAVTGKCKKL